MAFILNQVDETLQIDPRDRSAVCGHRGAAPRRSLIIDTLVEVGADLSILLHEHDARHVVLVALTPDGFGLGLNTGTSQARDSTIKHAQGALDFNGKVNVTRRIDDVEACDPATGWSSRPT